MNSLLIIEPNLRNASGHYAEFVRAVGLRAAGTQIEVLAHPAADAMLEEMSGVQVCRREPRVGQLWAEWRTIYRYVASGEPFLQLTADGRHAAAASLFSLLTGCRPLQAKFFFHRAPTTWRDIMLRPLTRPARESSLAITATEEVAERLRKLGWQRVQYVPYPAIAAAATPQPVAFSHLLMAGAARLNKGLDLVAELACNWAIEQRTVPLFVQVSKKHASRHGNREEKLVEKLLSSGYTGLTTSEDAPQRPDYIQRFAGALVLAPYSREQFASQVSGVVLDALLHGAPVIATNGTWPGALVERFGAGVVLYERTAAELASAIDRVLTDWSCYAAKACAAAQTLSREHDPSNLLKIISGSR